MWRNSCSIGPLCRTTQIHYHTHWRLFARGTVKKKIKKIIMTFWIIIRNVWTEKVLWMLGNGFKCNKQWYICKVHFTSHFWQEKLNKISGFISKIVFCKPTLDYVLLHFTLYISINFKKLLLNCVILITVNAWLIRERNVSSYSFLPCIYFSSIMKHKLSPFHSCS
jgi:hypothetical protein